MGLGAAIGVPTGGGLQEVRNFPNENLYALADNLADKEWLQCSIYARELCWLMLSC